jgi:uncharacterized membrane protein YphA (DoxX/SURF4 family)
MAASKAATVTGWVLTVLTSLLFVFSALMKFKGGPDLEKAMEHLGLPLSMVKPLGVLELACAIVYLIPPTAVVGAILLAGYVGGTIVTAWRSGDPCYVQIALGLLVWLGLYLREPRLKDLIPVRRPPR